MEHAIDGREAHASLAVDYERGRDGNAALLPRVEQVPVAHHLPPDIAQNWEWQPHRAPQVLSALWLVHRQGDDAITRPQKIIGPVAIIRQLTDAEGSPVAAVEDQDARSQ